MKHKRKKSKGGKNATARVSQGSKNIGVRQGGGFRQFLKRGKKGKKHGGA